LKLNFFFLRNKHFLNEKFEFREGRKGIDVVNDNVENSLMREVDNIKACQDRMKRTLEQVNHQLGVNR